MSASLLIQFISLGSAAFGLVMLFVSLFQMRKETWLKPIQSVVMLLSFTFPTVMLIFASGGMVNYTLGAVFLAFGLLIGLIIGARTKLRGLNGGIMGRRSRFPTFMWSLPSLATPLLARTGSPALFALGVMGILFGLGLVVASEGILFLRLLFFRAPAPGAYPAQYPAPYPAQYQPAPQYYPAQVAPPYPPYPAPYYPPQVPHQPAPQYYPAQVAPPRRASRRWMGISCAVLAIVLMLCLVGGLVAIMIWPDLMNFSISL